AKAPESFLVAEIKPKAEEGRKITLKVSGEDCTGCGLCVSVCPGKNKTDPTKKAINMTDYSEELRAQEVINWNYFMDLPEVPNAEINLGNPKGLALKRPLFEFSGAC